MKRIKMKRGNKMQTNITIREEQPNDYPFVYQAVKSAFENAEHTDNDEQNLVERLRKSNAYIPELSLVAELDGKIVGHIMFTKITVGNIAALALAPLSIVPEMQNKGIGGELIQAGHKIAQDMGYGFSIVVGHETYYPRFGYLPASSLGIKSPFEVPEKNFMAINLQGSQNRLEGTVEYPKEFFESQL